MDKNIRETRRQMTPDPHTDARLDLLLALLVALALSGCSPTAVQVQPDPPAATKPPPVVSDGDEATGKLQIHGYTFVLPVWWEEVDAVLPEDAMGSGGSREYITDQCGSDTGNKDTWRKAMKLWVQYYIRDNKLPVYIAHTYRAGEHHIEAAQTFAALHALAHKEGDKADWFGCYLSYNAGLSYRKAGNEDRARHFFKIAIGYANSEDDAIRYYAGLASERLNP